MNRTKKQKKMKYLITTVQKGARVNKNLLANMLAFAKAHNIDHIYTFVMNGKCKDEDWIDPAIGLAGIETIDSLTLNKNLRCRDMQVRAQKVLPLQGLAQKLSRDYSHILPATKVRLEMLSNLSKHPRAMITTGAISEPNYRLKTMLGMKAQEQHQRGFVMVEIKNSKIFNFNQIKIQTSGNFHFLNKFYYGKGKVKDKRIPGIVWGDLHIGITNKKALEESKQMLRDLKPEFCIFHDLFDGASLNPHTRGKFLTEMYNVKTKRDSLEKELKMVLKFIKGLSEEFPDIKFLVTEGNHDVFLRRYIDDKIFFNEPKNFMFIASMVEEMLVGKKATLQIALERLGEIPDNFKFFVENDEFRLRGVNVASHGHNGISGSRGNPKMFDNQAFKQMSGHTHKPQILNNVYIVGTLSELVQGYMRGPGAHAHCNGIIYDDGHMGLLMILV